MKGSQLSLNGKKNTIDFPTFKLHTGTKNDPLNIIFDDFGT